MGINCMVYLMDLRLLVRCLRLLELYDCLFSFVVWMCLLYVED